MTFTTPLGLLALLAIPVIVAIHLFRRRFPVRPVAGLFLWQITPQVPQGGGRIARLPITKSLLLECLAALALALILGGARFSPAAVSQHLVVVLDESASMAAVDGRGESARDRAARRILGEVDRLGTDARITLVRSGDRPSVALGPAALAVEAKTALESWRPDAPTHSLALGIRLARELAGPSGRLMIVSDLMPEPRGEPAVEGALWVAAGQPLANVGITAAERSVTLAEGRGAVSLTLGNYSDSTARRRIDVVAGDKNILARDVDVPPGVSSITLPIPAGLPPLRVALSGDPLVRDNEVTLTEPRPRLVAVENRLPDGRGREALANALAAVTGVTQAESGHLAFLDAGALVQPGVPGVWRAGFGKAPGAWVAGAPKDFVGPFVLEKRHPLLLGMTLNGVVWAGVSPLVSGVVRPVASIGDQVLIGEVGGATRVDPTFLVNLDLDRTNLIRSPDWPILVSNLVEMRRQALPGPERWNYKIGEWVRVRLGRDPKGPLRIRCGGIERDLPAGRLLEFIAPSPGGLLQVLEGNEVLFELGVNFLDEREADLRGQATADAGTLTQAAGFRGESGPWSDALFWLLLAIGGTALVANWWVLSPAGRSV